MNKTALSFFLIIAFWTQSLVPAGYMPSFSEEGALSIVVCSIDGYKEIQVSASESPEQQNDDHKDNSECPYSVLAYSKNVTEPLSFWKETILTTVIFSDFYSFISHTQRTTAHGQRAPPTTIL